MQAHYAWAVVDGLAGIWTMVATTVLERMVGKKSMNLFRSRWGTRTLILAMCLYYVLTPSSFPTGGVLSQLWVYSVPIWFYLTACNPMPPGWKKQVRASAKKLAVGRL